MEKYVRKSTERKYIKILAGSKIWKFHFMYIVFYNEHISKKAEFMKPFYLYFIPKPNMHNLLIKNISDLFRGLNEFL